jgi:PAS domain S-box-containing protein
MTEQSIPGTAERDRRIEELIQTMYGAEKELQELTGGQLDSVSWEGGRTILLSDAQERLRISEETQHRLAQTHAAILNALPANIALIDAEGLILDVNEAWMTFGKTNETQAPENYVGRNYLEICANGGRFGPEGRAVATGIRQVLEGRLKEYALEYPCHSATERRWSRLTVSPVRPDVPAGAVVMHVDITERRLATEALRTTMEEFRTLAEAVPQLVWMARPDGWTTYFNQHWVEYTGLGVEECLGDGWIKLFHPDHQEEVLRKWKEAMATKGDFVIESVLRRADGEYRWWLIRAVLQRDGKGNALKWFGTCTDVHDLKMAEMEAWKANRALKLMSEWNEKLALAQGERVLLEEVCRLAVEIGNYRFAWVGLAREDEWHTIEPVSFAGAEEGYLEEIKVSWSADNAEGRGPAGQTVRSGTPTICEDFEVDARFEAWREAARRRGYRGGVWLPLRKQENTYGILGLYTGDEAKIEPDELELLMKLADGLSFGLEHINALREVQDQAALLDATTDAITLRDINNRILFWNKGAERMMGWNASEVKGDDPREFMICDREKYDEALRWVMEKGNWAAEIEMLCKDGREITVDSRWTLLRSADGKPKAILGISTDVTERKQLEAQLLRVQRLESIGTLASGIAHDLNNALAPIMMGVGMLKDEIKSNAGKGILETMETSAQHGADLVRQVLSFARGAEGRRIRVNAGNLLNGIRDVINGTFPKNIVTKVTPAHDAWTVMGDPTQLNQVLTNLCVNARDAMPDGGTLTVSAENVMLDDVYAGMNPGSVPGAYLVISVQDTGTGIPAEIRDRIFEPFFTTKELGKGTGLGLSTTLGIIKNHGGFINLYSEAGRGTTFKVYLPANEVAGAEENKGSEAAHLPRGNGETVLLVDDEYNIRSIAQQTLERNGYNVLVASNGAEAVALYVQFRDQVAVVLTDMAMPVMDGPTMVVALRTLNPAIRIVGSSGMASTGGVAKAREAGVKYFAPKPYTAETLIKTLATALGD